MGPLNQKESRRETKNNETMGPMAPTVTVGDYVHHPVLEKPTSTLVPQLQPLSARYNLIKTTTTKSVTQPTPITAFVVLGGRWFGGYG